MGIASVLLAILALIPAPQKQSAIEKSKIPTVQVKLKSGNSFDGYVLKEDEASIHLKVSFGEIILKKAEIESIQRDREVRLVDKKAEPELTEDTNKKIRMGFEAPPLLKTKPKLPQEHVEEEVVAPVVVKPQIIIDPTLRGSDEKIQGYLAHYLWFFPEATSSRFVLGAAFFLIFILLFWMSCKLGGVEELEFTKAVTFSAVMFALLIIQVHFDAESFWLVLIYGVVNLGVWFGMTKYLLRENWIRGASVLAVFVFVTLLGVLGSEIGYVITNQYSIDV